MREVAFIRQNKEKWLEIEKKLYGNQTLPAQELSEIFVKINNDLAYSQTYYPKSNLNKYLNSLAIYAYHKVYKPKRSLAEIGWFWKVEVPLLCYKYRKYLYFSFFIFFLFVAVGVFSTLYEPSFVRSILGDAYVDMTIENIEKGDALAVYNNASYTEDFVSFFRISFNNFLVGLQAFVYGIFFGIGTFKILMDNAIMVGAFQTMFWNFNYFGLSLRTIWIHGSMEMFAACIEGGAGFLLGTGWLFPGTLTRKKAFFLKGKSALKIVISTLPFTISAALLEGYVTQFANEMPVYLAVSIILITLGFISFYYLIYPFLVKRKYIGHFKTLMEDAEKAV